MKFTLKFLWGLLLVTGPVFSLAMAEENEEDELYELYGGEKLISIASGI